MKGDKTTTGKHSIGEWYGVGLHTLPVETRQAWAQREVTVKGLTHTRCPFQEKAYCNKRGGVCSLRLYERNKEGMVQGSGSPVTTCPNRFLEGNLIYRWVAKTLLDTDNPLVLNEIGFLERLRTDLNSEETDDPSDVIGRIDNVLIHPEKTPLDWCALEIQAVYFSGMSMDREFRAMLQTEEKGLPFPAAHRRPDWRSSGPKRLLPQLQTKTPTIRTWGKKIAVVIDEPFFESLVGLEQEKHLSNAEIVWFVVRFQENETGWSLVPGKVVYTKLESSVKALTGGIPISKEAFEIQLRRKVRLQHPGHLVGS